VGASRRDRADLPPSSWCPDQLVRTWSPAM